MQAVEGLPLYPQVRVKRPTGWLIAVIALSLGLIGAGAFALFQTASVSSTRDDLASVRGELQSVQGDLTNTQGDLSDAQDTVDKQTAQLGACDRAIGIGVKMDQVLQDLVDNALYFEPLNEWNRLWNRYDALGRQWASAANQCSNESGNPFTFS